MFLCVWNAFFKVKTCKIVFFIGVFFKIVFRNYVFLFVFVARFRKIINMK